jgi:SET domain-containing protein
MNHIKPTGGMSPAAAGRRRGESRRERLLEHLTNKVYCRIAPSPLHGVGVFAVKLIPAGVDPFETFDESSARRRPEPVFVTLSGDDVRALPKQVGRILTDFYAVEADGGRDVPLAGPNGLNLSYYCNRCSNGPPNVTTVGAGVSTDGTSRIVTKRTIRPGEELLLDYREFDSDDGGSSFSASGSSGASSSSSSSSSH